jgi:hypothetical protein
MRLHVPRTLVGLDVSRLTDKQLQDVTAGVTVAAPKSTLIAAIPEMKASAAAMDQKSATLADKNKKVVDAKAALRQAVSDEAEARADLQGEVRHFVTLTNNNAKSPTEIQDVGLHAAPPKPPRNSPPEVPQRIDNRPPRKGHGKTVVVVADVDADRRRFAAEQSLDGGATWAPLGVTHGKTRPVTGPTGTKVWVRFAMIRGQLQSAWSVPILVTIP